MNMKILCVVLRPTEVQDDDRDLGDADRVEQDAHLLLVESLELGDALPEVDQVGGDLDLPQVLLLHLVYLHLLQAVPVHLLDGSLARHQHDAPVVGAGGAPDVLHRLPLQLMPKYWTYFVRQINFNRQFLLQTPTYFQTVCSLCQKCQNFTAKVHLS